MATEKDDTLNKAKKLIESQDVDGLVELINDSTIEPDTRISVWAITSKNKKMMFKTHPRVCETLVKLARGED